MEEIHSSETLVTTYNPHRITHQQTMKNVMTTIRTSNTIVLKIITATENILTVSN
jgi:hypothetical protein